MSKVYGGFSNEHLAPHQGHPENIFFGQWKAHPQSGLYVRFSHFGIALMDNRIISIPTLGFMNGEAMYKEK